MERRLQEEALNALGPPRHMPPISGDVDPNYREQVLEALRRSHGLGLEDALRRVADIGEMRRSQEYDNLDAIRRSAPGIESRLGPLPLLEWERRFREARSQSDAETILERKPISPHAKDDGDNNANSRITNECDSNLERRKSLDENTDVQIVGNIRQSNVKDDIPNEHIITSTNDVEKSRAESVPIDIKFSESPMTEEDRLSFLKSVSKSSSSNIYRENNPQGILSIPSAGPRMPNRDGLFYNSLNNNLFPFPSYPPIWPSMLPFSPLSKFYPPFSGSGPPHIPLDSFKNQIFSPLEARESRAPQTTDFLKEDPAVKKRLLDVILEVQRESGSGSSQEPNMSPARGSTAHSLPQGLSPVPSSSSSTTDQPIDLTVRRKRKMDKSEIVYKPGDEGIEDMESDEDKEEKTEKIKCSESMEIRTCEAEACVINSPFEGPLKVMKLENSSDALVV